MEADLLPFVGNTRRGVAVPPQALPTLLLQKRVPQPPDAQSAVVGWAQRAGLGEQAQSLLKTKLNMTLPEIELPKSLQHLTLFGGNKTERIGVQLRKKGLRPKHPVVIVPGAAAPFRSAPPSQLPNAVIRAVPSQAEPPDCCGSLPLVLVMRLLMKAYLPHRRRRFSACNVLVPCESCSICRFLTQVLAEWYQCHVAWQLKASPHYCRICLPLASKCMAVAQGS